MRNCFILTEIPSGLGELSVRPRLECRHAGDGLGAVANSKTVVATPSAVSNLDFLCHCQFYTA